MNGELRILGVAHGLLLGLVLASPAIGAAIGTTWLPWGVEALFVLAGFQLRLADRRWERRAGTRGWISHIRMAPARLVPWAATAVVAVIAGAEQAQLATSILIAVLLSELLVYPVVANILGRLPRPGLAGVLALVLIGCTLSEAGQVERLTAAFMLGVTGCVFWMRGPDGEARATLLAASGGVAAFLCLMLIPESAAYAIPVGALFATLTLAHMSVMRRRPALWHASGGGGLRWRHKHT